ncbi:MULTISPECIES: type I-E CRISPR-associated protein Cas7/Cse4/CasC [Aerococcus]|uniref:Type I-E CRISPR-associated protein Cas7/Cse4/CasC n=1 Tax=Aerococcus sanguinicola TaxID=119206 RepID=A0A5N1GPI0_9LACT|nr:MULTISPECIES: type I-E CRISPR-associated protein Cas7/Cse4/CasC [Aerococcus]KAA9302304.1 type I-E CRISPR-associated protein Cas7/Cse4/CasC [Aerococcus sanguinicola]MDK6678961.1 type I-E CRISPR-associated protein Cas7/Cse4/CasC [Aerococcus sp. UMB8608]MDK6686552.1 type I-E CRISPR-associated protein Cas7/Cse4/CasC [Aerococcus sp. UMB8623]MDK6939620.1 type I-E CRISPR-associated protein Cas7/Cse4/CasC [Aerococcus sp. UMB8487]
MTKSPLFLDIHAIQTLPPSNINRDDTGSPKTARYGGVQRARVSSQAWKRAMRDYFKEFGALDNVGVRSLEIVRYLAHKIQKLSADMSDEEAMALADKTINAAGVKTKDQRAKALFFLGDIQAEKLAQAALDGVTDKKELKALLKENPAIDIALFGRMVADDPSLNEDASAQVAHAISTHAVQTEFDFYTAVDDYGKEDNAGAGMLGTIEFNSSTLYRYADVAVHEFLQQLGGDLETLQRSLNLFLKAFLNSLPTGKVNTFANQTIPQAVLLSLRSDRPLSLVTAFESPVRAEDGFVNPSVDRLLAEVNKAEKLLDPAIATFYLNLDGDASDLASVETVNSLSQLQEAMDPVLAEQLDQAGE